jgi:hypothetical protein
MMAGDIKVKGSVLRSRLAFVEEQKGAEGLGKVLARLPAADRDALARLLPTSWYPFEMGSRLDEAIVQELGGGRPDYFLRLGAASAERNLKGVHRAFLRPGDPHAFLAQAPEIYAFYYDKGRRAYEPTGPRSGVLTTTGAATFSVPPWPAGT